jgi:hypothetical protein
MRVWATCGASARGCNVSLARAQSAPSPFVWLAKQGQYGVPGTSVVSGRMLRIDLGTRGYSVDFSTAATCVPPSVFARLPAERAAQRRRMERHDPVGLISVLLP